MPPYPPPPTPWSLNLTASVVVWILQSFVSISNITEEQLIIINWCLYHIDVLQNNLKSAVEKKLEKNR